MTAPTDPLTVRPRYLLDTDTCIEVLRGHAPTLGRVQQSSPDDLAIATMTEAELVYGARKSRDPAAGLARVDALLAGGLESLAFDRAAARMHAELRFLLRAQPIGERDLIIASIARSADRTLVTGNRAEFARVPGLACEDWMRAG